MFAGMMARPAATSARTNSGGDFLRDALREAAKDARLSFFQALSFNRSAADVLFVEVVADGVLRQVSDLGPAHVLADGDELHLRRDDARTSVSELRGGLAGLGTQRAPGLQVRCLELEGRGVLVPGGLVAVGVGEIAVINRRNRPAIVFLHVAARANPRLPQRRQSGLNGAGEGWIAPQPGAVIDADGRIRRLRAGEGLGG